jgi:hypothetical protein
MASNTTINMGNDEFIPYIRKNTENCNITNDDLGKFIWLWQKERGGQKTHGGKKQPCLWDKDAQQTDKYHLPYTATQFSFERSLLPGLYTFLDDLARK